MGPTRAREPRRARHAGTPSTTSGALTPKRTLTTRWCTDPDFLGAYSYLRPGGTPADRRRLQGELRPGLWLAGEYTSDRYPGSMQGAWFSGAAAADELLASGRAARADDSRPVLVIGAGLAGISAARVLADAGVPYRLVEAGSAPGGRVRTSYDLGGPVHLGAAWLHGTTDHPLTPLVDGKNSAWSGALFATDEGVEAGSLDEARKVLKRAALGAPRGRSIGDVVRAVAGTVPSSALAAAAAELSFTYGGALREVAARDGLEPFHLPGRDLLVTSPMDEAVDELVTDLHVEYGLRVRRVVYDRRYDRWTVVAGRQRLRATAVIVAVPLGVLQRRLEIRPDLPRGSWDALARLAPGRVAKVFAAFDEQWWQPGGHWYLAEVDGTVPVVPIWVDVTDLAGRPVLCGFTTGSDAMRLENLTPAQTRRMLGDLFTRYEHAFAVEDTPRSRQTRRSSACSALSPSA